MVLQDAEGNIASASCHIKHPHNRLLLPMGIDTLRSQASQLVHKGMLPVSMDPQGHEVIHQVVLVCHRVEHLVHQRLLLRCRD